jgi:ligand-binding sensor domain-containing protein
MRTFSLLLTVIACTAVTAQPSTSSVVDMLVIDNHIWAATSGGLFDYEPITENFDVYTNTRGLAMNQCNAIGVDGRGWIWVGAEDGRITRLDPQTGAVKLIFDLQNEIFEINAIVSAGDNVFVAANNGIYRFSYRTVSDNYRVLESIRVLGSFPGETRVAALAASDGYLYAATPQGLARASLDTESLSAPSSWTNFTATNAGLPQNDLRALFATASGVWGASSGFVFEFSGGTVANVSPLTGVVAFAIGSGQLYAASNSTVHSTSAEQPVNWTQLGQSLQSVSSLAVLHDGADELLVVGQPDNAVARG